VNKRIIPLIFLAVIFTVPALAVQSAYAGTSGGVSPEHTTITPNFGSSGAPVIFWGAPFMVTLDTVAWGICPTSTVNSINVELGFSEGGGGGGALGIEFETFFLQKAYAGIGGGSGTASQPMFPIGDGLWKANFPAVIPLHGDTTITYTWTCSNPAESGSMEDGNLFMDPSGVVTNFCTGDPIEGAQVTLNSDHDGNLNTVAPVGSYQPNINPLLTDVNGVYMWLVQLGFNYQVVVSAAGFGSQTSAILPVPPPQVGINFALFPEGGCPVGGEIIPIESTSLILAGFQSTAMWLLPIAVAGAGIAAFSLRKYWN